MRHRLGYKKHSRKSSHRMSMFRGLFIALVEHGCIRTTLPKAKSLRPIAERLITKASRCSSDESLSVRRVLLSRLNNRVDIVSKMLSEFPEAFKDRPGGYIRIYKCGHRSGDCAPMAMISLVNYKQGLKMDTKDLSGEKQKLSA